jgi:hypothetical protein
MRFLIEKTHNLPYYEFMKRAAHLGMRLDTASVKEFLAKEDRKQSYLVKQLNCSGSTVAHMLCEGYVPGERILKALAAIMGVSPEKLLIPKEEAKTA